MRILCLDYGSRRVGVALGDTETRMASPWDIWDGSDEDALVRRVRETLAREQIEKVVVGIPRPLGDRSRETDQAKEIRIFIARLRQEGIPVEEEDETLSSALAARQTREAGQRGKRDDLAAAVILQSYLDRIDPLRLSGSQANA